MEEEIRKIVERYIRPLAVSEPLDEKTIEILIAMATQELLEVKGDK